VVNSKKLIYEVKNWHDFQHDKREGRKMTWIKLYADLLDNQEFMSLDNDAQLLLIKCWLLACENQGKLPDVPEIAWRLRDNVDVVQESFAKLTSFILVASKMSKSLAECQRVCLEKRRVEKRRVNYLNPSGKPTLIEMVLKKPENNR